MAGIKGQRYVRHEIKKEVLCEKVKVYEIKCDYRIELVHRGEIYAKVDTTANKILSTYYTKKIEKHSEHFLISDNEKKFYRVGDVIRYWVKDDPDEPWRGIELYKNWLDSVITDTRRKLDYLEDIKANLFKTK